MPPDEHLDTEVLNLKTPPGGTMRVLENWILGLSTAWSPDHKRLALSFHEHDDYEACQLSVLDRWSDLRHKTGYSEWSCPDASDWSPNNKWILGTWWSHDGPGALFKVRQDGTRERFLGRAYEEGQDESYGRWMNNDRILYHGDTGGPDGIFSVNSDGSDHKLLVETDFIDALERGPKRGRVAYAVLDGTKKVTEEEELFIMHADGSHRRQITNNQENELAVVWSPDGTKLAVVVGTPYKRPSRRTKILIYNTSSWALTRGIDPSDHMLSDWPPPIWSPDSRWLAYIGLNVDGKGRKAVFAARPNGGRIEQATPLLELYALLDWTRSSSWRSARA